jgi:hypothetical protein
MSGLNDDAIRDLKCDQILKNQIEIMWVLHLALGKLLPDLVGRGGELDMLRNDLTAACKETKKILVKP